MGVFGGSNGIESIIRYVALLLLGMGAKLKTCGALAADRGTFIGDFSFSSHCLDKKTAYVS